MPQAGALCELLADWDRNPYLERLERNRVLHLANSQVQVNAARGAQRRLAEQRQQFERQRQLLERILESRAFWAVERLVRLRHQDSGFSPEEIRRVLDGNQNTATPSSSGQVDSR